MSEAYPRLVSLYIDGQWTAAAGGETLPIHNPATGEEIGQVAHARKADLDRALAAAERGLAQWRQVSTVVRARILRKASAILRERIPAVARLMTQEQGKPLGEALGELERTCDTNDWLAGEGERIYGRLIPARAPNVTQMVLHDPIGVVVGFTPWNFPTFQMVRKTGGALAAGCSIIVKGPEEAPASCAELIRAYHEAGVPPGVVNLVYGTPAEISSYLVPQPLVRKVSFTGSTVVGKQLAALAGQHMKVTTFELGGHAPVLVFADANLEAAAAMLCGMKYRNAGQSCINPTRYLVQRSVYAKFVELFTARARGVKVGNGLDGGVQMGPMANPRRVAAVQAFVEDAVQQGARLTLGGKRIGARGNFFEPTVLGDVPLSARAMNEEPFGPVALFRPFDTLDEAITEANRLPYGLGAYAFTTSPATARAVVSRVESGMISINHLGLGMHETPFGGVKDSGYGFEGGSEAIEAYIQTRFATLADL